MSFNPCVLIVGTPSSPAEEVVKLILKNQTIVAIKHPNDMLAYRWHINNKYYSADVHLCSATIDTDLHEVEKFVEALIIYVDITKKNCIEELDKFSDYLKNHDNAEKVLIYKSSSEVNENTKELVDDWCVKNKYEFVDLERESEKTISEDIIQECVGIERVIEILHAHEWPNLTMKGKPSNNNPLDVEIIQKSLDRISSATHDTSKCDDEKNQDIDETEFENMEQLAALFGNLRSVKQELSFLDTQQKLDQAEKVVKTFWKAIGGDDDEFSDSDHDFDSGT